MSHKTANVTIFVPNSSVATMQDELANKSVEKAVAAAIEAYTPVDSDQQVPVVEYSGDFDDAVELAVQHAAGTDGADILVIITDFESDDRAKAERLLEQSDDMFVLVPVSNQGYDTDWAAKLDNDAAGDNNVDVVTVENLSDPSVALAEVNTWLATAGV